MSRKDFIVKDKKGNKTKCGYMEIVNKSDTEEDLFFYGDIISYSYGDDYKSYYPDDKCPTDVKELLDSIDDNKTLNIHINSGGGSVFGGIAIYNLLKNKKCKKNVYIDGIAASIASVIACCGDNVYIPNNATFMIHKPTNGYFFTSMNAEQLRKDADALDNCQKAIITTYMKHVKDGVTEEKINQLVNNETWMTGEEACKYFNFELQDDNKSVACASDFYNNYKNTPNSLKSFDKQQTEKIDINKLADIVAEKVQNSLQNNLQNKEKKYREDIKNSLLNYGK